MAASIREILGVVKWTSLEPTEAGLSGRAKTSPPTGQRLFLEFRFRSGRRLTLDKEEDLGLSGLWRGGSAAGDPCHGTAEIKNSDDSSWPGSVLRFRHLHS